MKTGNILVIDDDAEIREIVQVLLSSEGYTVETVADGMQALTMLTEKTFLPDVIILDIMMPKLTGLEACMQIREFSNMPIIMLTARSEERDELQGFDLGVDEYISKPFSPKILVARVNAILRRANVIGESNEINAGGIVIDKAAHQVKIDDKEIELSFKEFELLTYFVENQGIALSSRLACSRIQY